MEAADCKGIAPFLPGSFKVTKNKALSIAHRVVAKCFLPFFIKETTGGWQKYRGQMLALLKLAAIKECRYSL